MAIFTELKIADFPGLCVASLRTQKKCFKGEAFCVLH